MSAEALEK